MRPLLLLTAALTALVLLLLTAALTALVLLLLTAALTALILLLLTAALTALILLLLIRTVIPLLLHRSLPFLPATCRQPSTGALLIRSPARYGFGVPRPGTRPWRGTAAAMLRYAALETRNPMPREMIDTGKDKRYVRRDAKGQFKESDDMGRSLATDRRHKAKRTVKKGEGDRGDQKRR
jgi:hypothetical protein